MEEYSKEQLKELYEQLPEKLKAAVYSYRIGDDVKKICEENGMGDSYAKILKQVGYVFLGILSPEEFKNSLQHPDIFAQINNGVFLNLKSDLEPLYGIKIEEVKIEKEKVKTGKPTNNPPKSKGGDKYLEPIE